MCSCFEENVVSFGHYRYVFISEGFLKPTATRSCPPKCPLYVNLYLLHPFQLWAIWNRSDPNSNISCDTCVWRLFNICLAELSPFFLGCGSVSHQGHDSGWVSQTKVPLPQHTKIIARLCGLLSERSAQCQCCCRRQKWNACIEQSWRQLYFLFIQPMIFFLVFSQLSTTRRPNPPARTTKRSWLCLKRTVRSFPTWAQRWEATTGLPGSVPLTLSSN